VSDWSFYCAPGTWTYWTCSHCGSLYLDPRPTVATIGSAYGTYYTHSDGGRTSLVQQFRLRLINECWSQWLGGDFRPRLHIPAFLGWLLSPLRARLTAPFELEELRRMPAGRLLDVGCGDGRMLDLASQLGWTATGLDFDPAAAQSARSRGLDAIEGSYVRVSEFSREFDCIICSHVLEHVHDPVDLLRRIGGALKEGGTLLLATPNASSRMRQYFGDAWRGLEAPRHLGIPSMRQLDCMLREMGFAVRPRSITRLWTAAESFRIQRRGARVNASDKRLARKLAAGMDPASSEANDFVEFICVKGAKDAA